MNSEPNSLIELFHDVGRKIDFKDVHSGVVYALYCMERVRQVPSDADREILMGEAICHFHHNSGFNRKVTMVLGAIIKSDKGELK